MTKSIQNRRMLIKQATVGQLAARRRAPFRATMDWPGIFLLFQPKEGRLVVFKPNLRGDQYYVCKVHEPSIRKSQVRMVEYALVLIALHWRFGRSPLCPVTAAGCCLIQNGAV